MGKKQTRQTIIDENLLVYKDIIDSSERNINIVEDYVSGMSLSQVGEKYHISNQRVRTIIVTYIVHCHWYIRDKNKLN